jgi:GNAT superfamily N-acetyltransferase
MVTTSDNVEEVLRNATTAQLEQAVAENHRQLFCCNATALGGIVHTADGLTYTYSAGNGSAVVFPAMVPDKASMQLDVMMDFYRANGATNIGYWSLDPAVPADVDARLLARGFQPGWKPCWMALEVVAMQTNYTKLPGLEIRVSNDIPVHEVEGLPYGDDGGTFSGALFRTYPNKVQRFVAFLDGTIVGQTCLFFTAGTLGIAGMYNVGVIPSMQRKGIGKALVIAASRYAKERGYHYVMLNANHIGRRTYEQVGFRVIGYGLTWWITSKRYITHPASPQLIALAEATGTGDLAALESAGASPTPAALNTPLANGMTLIQLAAHCRQPAAAEWLMAHGVACTALVMWDLGWKDRAAALLAVNPQEVNRTFFDWEGNLLHIAAQRGDTELAKLALEAGVDLTMKDKEHGGIPLGWAYYFGRTAIIKLIENNTGE